MSEAPNQTPHRVSDERSGDSRDRARGVGKWKSSGETRAARVWLYLVAKGRESESNLNSQTNTHAREGRLRNGNEVRGSATSWALATAANR